MADTKGMNTTRTAVSRNDSTTTFTQAYLALSRAAERVGAWGYATKKGRRYSPTTGHRQLVQAMADLGYGRITPEEAMATLHYGQSAVDLDAARTLGF